MGGEAIDSLPYLFLDEKFVPVVAGCFKLGQPAGLAAPSRPGFALGTAIFSCYGLSRVPPGAPALGQERIERDTKIKRFLAKLPH